MCSIIGYFGIRTAAPLLVKALKRMEYRGYDSAGIATVDGGHVLVRKGVGKVAEVNIDGELEKLPGRIGIGHTRWATHGGVSVANAHPHASWSGGIAIVHNGIIENFQELKDELGQRGYLFRSQTDSEVIANLLQCNMDLGMDVEESVTETVLALRGKYAFAAVFDNGSLVAARHYAPLILGIGRDGYFVSSDILGFVEHTDEVIYLDNRQFVTITPDGIRVSDFDTKPVKRQIVKVSSEFGDSEKGDYVHYTLKEIYEQPTMITRAGNNFERELQLLSDLIKESANVYVTGSGTSYNAALIAKYLFSKYGKVRVEPVIASEAQFFPTHYDEDSLLIALSQSGESADVLEAANIASGHGAKVVSIVNVMTSSLARLSSVSIGLNCGPEIGVAATKSFTSQLATLYQITNGLCEATIRPDFEKISKQMSTILFDHSMIERLAKDLKDVSDIYVLGNGIHYHVAAEASLKLKELSYIHAEALPSGELKHGPLALLDSSAYVLVINPQDSTHLNTLASAHEVKARGAKIIGVSDAPSELYDNWIQIPRADEPLSPLLEIIPIQLLAYYAAVERNVNPDYPRNLAKSVTVK